MAVDSWDTASSAELRKMVEKALCRPMWPQAQGTVRHYRELSTEDINSAWSALIELYVRASLNVGVIDEAAA